jgi:hypothetical protein
MKCHLPIKGGILAFRFLSLITHSIIREIKITKEFMCGKSLVAEIIKGTNF